MARQCSAVVAIVVTLSLVGCDAAMQSPSATAGTRTTAAASVAPSASLAPPPAPTASPSPSPEPTLPPAVDVVVNRFARRGTTDLQVEIANPNESWGLVRSRFEVTLLDKSGSVLAVEGTQGVPGASCCTIYQLGPGQPYAIDVWASVKSKKVAAVEVRTIDEWYPWGEVAEEAALVGITKPKVKVRALWGSRQLHVTGRLEVDQAGPFNVQVLALVVGSKPSWLWLTDVVDCVRGGRSYAFDLEAHTKAPVKPKLKQVYGIVTTIPGYGDTDTPPGCS